MVASCRIFYKENQALVIFESPLSLSQEGNSLSCAELYQAHVVPADVPAENAPAVPVVTSTKDQEVNTANNPHP